MITWRSTVLVALIGLLTVLLAQGLCELLAGTTMLRMVPREVVPAAGVAILAAFVAVAGSVWRFLKGWRRRPVTILDVYLASLTSSASSLALKGLVGRGNIECPKLSFIVAAVGGGLLAWRWGTTLIMQYRTPQPGKRTPEGELLDTLLGPEGMDAGSDLGADFLERKPLLDILESVITHRRETPLVLGIDGPWGSGKTTLLNALEKKLPSSFVVVRFDAWSFREPDRVVGNYLKVLGDALQKAGSPPSVGIALARLGAGIATVSGPRLGGFVSAIVKHLGANSVSREHDELRRTVAGQARPVAVLIDDLDRLDHDELHAALRMVRLLSDIPRVVHVLAYDRTQVARLLFPQEDSAAIARDFMAKIVALEFPLATPTQKMQGRILDRLLKPLFDEVEETAAQEFVDRLNGIPRRMFIAAMPTPRDIRRIAAATALIWATLKRDVNLFDLFMLQLVRIRFPRVFEALHAHPEWFIEIKWSGDMWRISEEPAWKKESEAYIEKLSTSTHQDDVVAARVLSMIFPVGGRAPYRATVSEAEARKGRRIQHPDIFARYFLYSVGQDQIAESKVEDLALSVKAVNGEPERIDKMTSIIHDEVASGRAGALLDQWDIFLGSLKGDGNEIETDLARSVAIGMARGSALIPGSLHEIFSPKRQAAVAILHTIDGTQSGSAQSLSQVASPNWLIKSCVTVNQSDERGDSP